MTNVQNVLMVLLELLYVFLKNLIADLDNSQKLFTLQRPKIQLLITCVLIVLKTALNVQKLMFAKYVKKDSPLHLTLFTPTILVYKTQNVSLNITKLMITNTKSLFVNHAQMDVLLVNQKQPSNLPLFTVKNVKLGLISTLKIQNLV